MNAMRCLAFTLTMSTFLLTLLGLAAGSALQCAVYREIAPCTCRVQEPVSAIHVTCERMRSFQHVRETLAGKFAPDTEVYLLLGQSELKDMANHSFTELGFNIVNLKLNFDTLEELPSSSFFNLKRPEFLSLADNALEEIPNMALGLMPAIRTLDIARNRLRTVRAQDFALSRDLKHLVLASNELDTLEHGAWPRKLRHLHLGRNELRTLNGTLRELSDLEWLFLNGNQLDSLENQLPIENHKLMMFHAGHNRLDSLPVEFRSYLALDTLFLQHNALRGLGGALQHTRRLKRLILEHNLIHELAEDEFSELEILEELNLGHNRLTSLNGSLTPLRRLRCLNLTSNHLHEFSLNEIRGLRHLHIVDLSHNRLTKLTGRIEQNVVESETRVMELRLEHNALQSLDGFLMGLHGLLTLNLSHNQLAHISPDDLIGLEKLTVLDISFNRLTTLEETSKTFLPSLETLFASHNTLSTLEYDFHGLPVLCLADVSYNEITFIGSNLADKTRCTATGSRDTLNVYIQGNPVSCAGNLTETIEILKSNQAELHGLVPICTTPDPPVLPLLQMVNASAAVLEVID